MPIVKLLEGQELELEATAILGQGKNTQNGALDNIIKFQVQTKTNSYSQSNHGTTYAKRNCNKALDIYNKQLEEFAELVKKLE